MGIRGDLYLSLFEEGKGSTILAEDGQEIKLKPPDWDAFFFPHVQRFTDGRWLVVESRTRDSEPNAFVLGADGSFSHSFYAGDGLGKLLIDQSGGIWIGYFDEGIFGASHLPAKHTERRFAPNGLICVDDLGEVKFGFNEIAGNRDISDIYALSLDDEDRIWLCPYTDFFLASIDGRKIDFVLDQAPVTGASALSVGPNHFAFFGSYYQNCTVTVVERETQRLRLVQLLDQQGNPFSPQLLATRGKSAVAMADDRLYGLDLDLLLNQLGPWNDENSSSVASAVQYMKEENSYAGSQLIDVETGQTTEIPGEPRPPENQPRDNVCS